MPLGTKTSGIERYVHDSGEDLEIPVARIVGARAGPRFSVSAGMHAGESSGIHAAIRLWRDIDPADLSGELLIIPIMSMRAFFSRSMQLSPVDGRELHFQAVGRSRGSYSEFHIDCVFNLIRDSDYHVDMHGAEYVQALDPWIAFLEPADAKMREAAWLLASSFPVSYLDPRARENMPDGLPLGLLEAGVVNVWTEIGLDHRLQRSTSDMQYQGVINALNRLGMLDGEPIDIPDQVVVGPNRWSMTATASGYWRRRVQPGDRVNKGQLLGEVRDLEGHSLEKIVAPANSLVQYVATSPAINAERQPHGYNWHQGLARLVEVRDGAEAESGHRG